MRGDLHCHTRLSDGSAGIEEVIANAKASGIHYVAITDHDTISSFSRSKVIAQRYGVEMIEGVEISCYDYQRSRKVHILCYRPKKPDRLLAICNKILDERKQAGLKMAKNVMKRYPIFAEGITKYSSSSKCIYRQHIMNALLDAGYATSIHGALYDKLFKEENACNVGISYPDVHEVLQVVHSSGGIAVLAHPRVYDSFELLEDLIAENLLDGVEVWHPRNNENDSETLLQITLDHGLIPTGGSDFHGMYSSVEAPVGKCYTPQKYMDLLFARKKQED